MAITHMINLQDKSLLLEWKKSLECLGEVGRGQEVDHKPLMKWIKANHTKLVGSTEG